MANWNRRRFLGCSAAAALSGSWVLGAAGGKGEEEIRARCQAHRPSRLKPWPADFPERVGAAHVAGKYHLTGEPFLLEGAKKLLELGTRLGKFWFMPHGVGRDYPYNSRWGEYGGFVDLARGEYFRAVFEMPFRTIFLEAHSPVENGWQGGPREEAFYERIEREFHDLTAYLYQTYRHREMTFVLQHWEGDWLLRGRGGELWDPPPEDWPRRCEAMVRWLAARQAGVSRARAERGKGARCVVAHAAEVNRVADLWKRIPTMTEQVLPKVEVDLVSYSAYDGMKDEVTLWRCLAEIQAHCRTGALFGPRAVCVGEMGIPENETTQPVAERWDELMGAMLAAGAKYMVHWELYCNELNPKVNPRPKPPVKDPQAVRGFWLVRPDGSLSEGGKYFSGLWRRKAGQ